MRYFLFTLSMPNICSWNGKWSSEGTLFCRVRSYSFRKNSKKINPVLANVMSKDSCYYDFGDGWGASVSIRECTRSEKSKFEKLSKGFCQYDWMIDEIEKYGKILTLQERDELKNSR